ncbi:MAG: OmpA family protein [Flavobacteriales bacterium]|nr:OmpA family protein [Flavobacteriales bacterium]
MRSLLIILLFTLSIPYVNAQGRIEYLDLLWEDQFDGKNSHFSDDLDEDADFLIKGGRYEINHKKEGYYHTKYNSINLNPGLDFTIETKVRWMKGADDGYFGLVWGYDDLKSHYDFVIRNDGTYRIMKKKNGTTIYPRKWEASSALKTFGEWNTLKVVKSGMKIQFYINDQMVYENSFWPFYGSNIGFKVHDKCKVQFEYITVNQPRKVRVAAKSMSPYKKENLGAPVNTKYSEISCLVSHDATMLVLNRDDHPGNMDAGEENDDIWMSKKLGDNWSAPVNMKRPLNNSGNNYVVSISADNNSLLINNTYKADGSSDGSGFSISHRTAKGWELPKTIDVIGYSNDGDFGGACLSADRKVMIMTLEDGTSKGRNDLYVSFAESEEVWSHPKNLGSVINSFDHEYSPFLAADGKTLYFASQSHAGYGGADIFVSRRLDNTWRKWSKPLNLGRSVNTHGWDGHFCVTASGEYAYITSYVNTLGSADIFRIKLKEEMRPDPVVILSGRVLDSKTGKPIGASLSYHELKSDNHKGYARSDPQTGSYRIILTEGHEYSFYAKEKGYVSVHYNQDFTKIDKYAEISHDIYLTPLELNQTIVMNNVFFEPNMTELLSKSKPEIDRLLKLMKGHGSMQIVIGGHTNPSKAPDSFHDDLSIGRASAVRDYLIDNGINGGRVVAIGYGVKFQLIRDVLLIRKCRT